MRGLARLPLALVSLLLLVACGDATGPTPIGSPAQFTAISGTPQSGPIASRLSAPLVVRVTDAKGQAIPNVSVSWSASAGTVSAATSSTNEQGQAQVEWTLGTSAGEQTARASVTGLSPVTFTATATAGAPARLEKMRGDGQNGTPGADLMDTLVVTVSDAHGNAISGVAVTWTVTGGGGSMVPVSATTDAAGRGKALWILGTAAGQNTASATVAGAGTVTFTATTTGGAPARLERVSGDNQSGTAGSPLPTPLVVRITDANGNPIGGAQVTWTVTGGGGGITPMIGTTDAQGHTSATWTLSTAPGAHTARAAAAGQTVDFAATGVAGAAARLEKVAGDNQSGAPGTVLPDTLVVRVTDTHGNGIGGVAVAWAITGGGGSLVPVSPTTDPAGLAKARWTVGTAVGQNTATAAAGDHATVTFTATTTAGTPVNLQKVSGDEQTAVAGTPLPHPLVVRVLDAYGNPVSGARVVWTTVGQSGRITPDTATSGAAGRVEGTWTLDTIAGGDTARAVLPQRDAVTFTATATPGPIAALTVTPDTARMRVGETRQLTATANDRYGNEVTGFPVSWTSSDITKATVSQSGLVTAVAVADSVIIAASADGAAGSARLRIALAAITQWTIQREKQSEALFGVWVHSDSVAYAVGGDELMVNDGWAYRYNGTAWSSTGLTNSPRPSGVWGTSPVNVYAVAHAGSDASVVRYDGTRWSGIGDFPRVQLQSIRGTSPSNVYTVGSNGSIFRYDGAFWTPMQSGTISHLFAVWPITAASVYAVGAGGTLLHFDGSAWTLVGTGTIRNLLGVWAASPSSVYAVGENGTVVHYNGSSSRIMVSGTTANLRSVWGTSDDNIYAVGGGGTILHYDGTSWKALSSGTTRDLLSVYGTPSGSSVFATGMGGTILYGRH